LDLKISKTDWVARFRQEKKKANVLADLLEDYGNDLCKFEGQKTMVEKHAAAADVIASKMANSVDFVPGYKIQSDWFRCAIIQLVQRPQTAVLFQSLGWDPNTAVFPVARGGETIEHIDFNSVFTEHSKTNIVRLKLIPTEKFYPGATVKNRLSGKLYEVSTREADRRFLLISNEGREYKKTHYEMRNFEVVE
jgi:hypothetical protein